MSELPTIPALPALPRCGPLGYCDREARWECYVNYDDEVPTGEICVVVPSDIWINPKQAREFGEALIKCAEYLDKDEEYRKYHHGLSKEQVNAAIIADDGVKP